MAEPRTIVVGSGNLGASASFEVPAGVRFDVEAVYVEVDASGGGATTAELTVSEQSGEVIAKKQQGRTISGVGSATWALRLDDEDTATPSGGSMAAWASMFKNYGNATPIVIPPFPGAYVYDVDFTGGTLRTSDPAHISWSSGFPQALVIDTADPYTLSVWASCRVNIQPVGGLANYHPAGVEMFLFMQDGMNIPGTVNETHTSYHYLWGGGAPTVVNQVMYTASWIDVENTDLGSTNFVYIELANHDSTNANVQLVQAELRATLTTTEFDTQTTSPLV